jgi:acetyltransferase-like isoleucine patch superfamily enzyme
MVLLSAVKYLKKVALAIFSYLPQEFKIFFYRFMGAEIGNNVDIGLGSIIIPLEGNFKKINIGDNVVIEDGVRIIAKNLFLGTGTQIKNNTKVSGQSGFTTGKNVYIDQECHFDLRRDITLGNDVVISGGCWFYTHMVFHSVLDGAPYTFGPIIVEERTYLGANAFVLPGITIGPDALIGARSVVTKNVNPDTVIVGQPAKEIGKTSQRIRTITPEGKNVIVKDILLDFMQTYHENIVPVKFWDNAEMIFLFHDQAILYLPRADHFSDIEERTKNFKKPSILISFGIPEKIKIACDTRAIFWFDLESRTKSSKKNKLSNVIERFIKGYGISVI